MQLTSGERQVLVIIGPSGAGKSTIVRYLVDEGLVIVTPTWTTRQPRPNELEEGVEHRFTDEKTFSKKDASGEFLIKASVFGLPYQYGMPKVETPSDGKIPLVMLRAQIVPMFKEHYNNFIVYQIEDDLQRVKERLLERERHGEAMGTRLDDFTNETEAGRALASRVFINDTAEVTAQQIKQALRKDFPHL